MAQVLANLSNKELLDSFPVFYELLELKLKKRREKKWPKMATGDDTCIKEIENPK